MLINSDELYKFTNIVYLEILSPIESDISPPMMKKRLWRFEDTKSSKSGLEASSAAIGGGMNAQSTWVCWRGEMRRVGR
jgi:hypothetical protein